MLKIKNYIFIKDNIRYIQATEENLYIYLKDSLYAIPIANATLNDIKKLH